MSFWRQLKSLAAALVALSLWLVVVVSSTHAAQLHSAGSISSLVQGTCTTVSPATVFRVSNIALTADTIDETERSTTTLFWHSDILHFYIVDGANRVLGSERFKATWRLGETPMRESVNFDVAISSPPSIRGVDFRFAVIDATSATRLLPPGQYLSEPSLFEKPFDAGALDPACAAPLATPKISSLSQSRGRTEGGDQITILGKGFTGTQSILFGSDTSPNFTFVSDTTLLATTPAARAGTVSLSLVNRNGTHATPEKFTFEDQTPPTLSAVKAAANHNGTTSVKLGLQFSEPVSFNPKALAKPGTLLNASLVSTRKLASDHYELELQPTAAQDLSLTLPGKVFQDLSGNDLASGSQDQIVIRYAGSALRVQSIRPKDKLAADGSLSWTVEFSTAVALSPRDLEIRGTSATIISVTPMQEEASRRSLPKTLWREFFGAKSAFAQSPLSARSFIVTISGGDLSVITGTVSIAIASSNSITDAQGNALGSTIPAQTDQSAIIVTGSGLIPTLAISAPSQVTGPFQAKFTASENIFNFDLSDISVTNGSAQNFQAISQSLFTVDVTPITAGGVAIVVSAGSFSNANSILNSEPISLAITYIDPGQVRTQTSAVIANFLSRRAEQIASSQPDLSGRLNDSGAFASSGLFNFQADASDRALSINFSGSLSRFLAAYETGDQDGTEPAPTTQRFNVWTMGTISQLNSLSTRQSFGAVHLGADYRVTPKLLLGVAAQIDWASERDNLSGVSASGSGWMAGPYLVAKLRDNLVFDARLAFGRSSNSVSPLGVYTDGFETSRVLATSQLTGSMKFQGWKLEPQASVLYFREQQKAYRDSNGIVIPAQTVELGQLSFGPKLTKSYKLSNALRFEPSITLKGIWNFAQTGHTDIATGLKTGQDARLRARLEARAQLVRTDGWQLAAHGFYDGIGTPHLEAYGASAELNVPF